MKKIKILRIIARLNIGGPAIHTILLTEGLDKSRFESILVTGTAEKREGDMFFMAKEKSVHPFVIPELGRALNIRRDFIAFWKLYFLIKREKPNIIHTHTAKAGALGRLAGLLHKLIAHFSFEWIKYFRKGFSDKPEKSASSHNLKLIHTFHGHVLHNYFSRIKSILFAWIEKFLALFSDKIIAVSESVREELIHLRIAPPEKIVTIPLGLELEKYLKIENCDSKNHKSVGIIGRLVPIKNHKMFLDAAKKINEILGFRQGIKFLIVGDGSLRKELEHYAEKLGIRENVTFTGWEKDLKKIFSNLDIVTLTSLNEGTPVSMIEAQAAARPCVATNVGGVANVIEDGRSGFLVPSQDTKSFVESLIKLLNNPTLMHNMGEYGREIVKERFSKSRLINDIKALYQQEISR